jgi:hypothetical protein
MQTFTKFNTDKGAWHFTMHTFCLFLSDLLFLAGKMMKGYIQKVGAKTLTFFHLRERRCFSNSSIMGVDREFKRGVALTI